MKRMKMLLSALLAVTVLLSQFTLTSFAATTKNLTEDFASFDAGAYGKNAYTGTDIKVTPVNQAIRYVLDGGDVKDADDNFYATLEGYQTGLSKIHGLFKTEDGKLELRSSNNRSGFGAIFSGLNEAVSETPVYIATGFDFKKGDTTNTYEIALSNGTASSSTTNNLRFLKINANGNIVWSNATSNILFKMSEKVQYKILVFGEITSTSTKLHLLILDENGNVVANSTADLGACSIAIKAIGIFNSTSASNMTISTTTTPVSIGGGCTTKGSVYIDNLSLKTYATAADMNVDEMAAISYEVDDDGNYVVYSEDFDGMSGTIDSSNKAGFDAADFNRGTAEVVDHGTGKAVKFINSIEADSNNGKAFNIERTLSNEVLYDFDMTNAANASKVEAENVEISASYCFYDFNLNKTLMIRGNKTDDVSDQTTFATINTDGKLSFGELDTGKVLQAETWYNFNFKLNINTGYCVLKVTEEDNGSVIYNSADDKMLNVHDFYDKEKRVVEHKIVRTGFSLLGDATKTTAMSVDNFTVKVLKNAVAPEVVCSGFGVNASNAVNVTLYTTNEAKVKNDTKIILAAYNSNNVLVGAKMVDAPITTTPNTSYTCAFDTEPEGATKYKAFMFDSNLTPMVYAK
jgi:hypothetical protein